MSEAELGDFGIRVLLAATSFYLAFVLAAAAHEIGHLLAATAAGLPVRLVTIGAGPRLLHGPLGQVEMELRAVPLVGITILYPVGVLRKIPQMLFMLGGALGNAAVILALAWLDRIGLLPERLGQWLGPMVFAQLYFMLANLIPFTTRRSGASDGLHLLRLIRHPRSQATAAGIAYAARLARYSSSPALQPSASAASARIAYALGRADGSTKAGLRREAMQALARELASGRLPRPEELLVLDALTGACLVLEAPDLATDLDAWSARAFGLAPELETIRGSRGAVLVLLERNDEAKALLAPLAAAAASPFDAFMSSIFIARAECRLGRIEEARRLNGAARARGLSCRLPADLEMLLARVESEIEAHRSEVPASGDP